MPSYIQTPYAPDQRTMLDLMRLASADRARADAAKTAIRTQGILNIGQLIAGTLAGIQEDRQKKALMQSQMAKQQEDDAFKRRDQQIREAEAAARIDQQQQTAARQAQMDQRQAQMDAEKRGTATVNDMGGYGPLAESQVDDVMQSPAAGRTRYAFGPGMANGPEVQPSAPQLQQMEMRKKLEGMGYSFGPNGQVIPPQKPEAPPRPVSVPDGGRLVDPATGKVVYTAPPKSEGTGAMFAGNWDVSGDDFLKTIPAQWRKTVEKIAHYDEDPTKVASMRGGNREQLMAWVNQVNPTYDSSVFSNIAPTRKAFSTGVQGRQVNALNTAIGHIDQLTNLAAQLDQGGFVPGNRAWNAVRTAFGSDKVTNFDTLKDALGGEIAGVLAQNGATVSSIQDAKSHISNASSAAQLAGYINTQIPIMGSKLAALNDSYQRGMQGHDNRSLLSEASKAILAKHGFNPEHPEIGATKNAPIKVGGFTVREKPQ